MTREETELLIQRQLNNETPCSSGKPGVWHYGKVELSELLDHLFGPSETHPIFTETYKHGRGFGEASLDQLLIEGWSTKMPSPEVPAWYDVKWNPGYSETRVYVSRHVGLSKNGIDEVFSVWQQYAYSSPVKIFTSKHYNSCSTIWRKSENQYGKNIE